MTAVTSSRQNWLIVDIHVPAPMRSTCMGRERRCARSAHLWLVLQLICFTKTKESSTTSAHIALNRLPLVKGPSLVHMNMNMDFVTIFRSITQNQTFIEKLDQTVPYAQSFSVANSKPSDTKKNSVGRTRQ